MVLLSCAIAVLLYVYGACCLSRAPHLVRRQASFRALCYVGGFFFTFGPLAVIDLAMTPQGSSWLFFAVWFTMKLNGATNAVSYEFWLRRERAPGAKSVAYRVAFALEPVVYDVLLVDLEPDFVADEAGEAPGSGVAPCPMHGHEPRRGCGRCQSWVAFIESGVRAAPTYPCQMHGDVTAEGCLDCQAWLEFVAAVAKEIEAWSEVAAFSAEQ